MDFTAIPLLRDRRRRLSRQTALLAAAALLLAMAHGYVRSLSPSERTPLILLDHLFNLGLVALLLLACTGLGLRLMQLLDATDMESEPKILSGLALGLGVVGYGVFALGILGLFQPGILVFAAAALLLATIPETSALLPDVRRAMRAGWTGFKGSRGPDRILALLGAAGFAIALPIALAPPTDYDGLMYHLAVPAAFLQAGRVYAMPMVDQANFPFTAEMIFSLGLALGSDAFGRLVNLLLWGCVVMGTLWLGSRYLGRPTGAVGALVLLTVPGAYLASSTSVEILWTLFLLAGVLMFFHYLHTERIGVLVLMGIFGGLVLGTKALAVGLPLALGVSLAVHLALVRRVGPLVTLGRLAVYSAVVSLVASPWYLKNWLWLGSPLYPLFTGSDDWARYHFLSIAGFPKTVEGFLALPMALFFPPGEWTFSVGLPSYFFLSYLFLALPAIALTRGNLRAGYMLLIAAIFSALWAAGNQLLRLLYPIYPLLGLLVAHGLVEARWRGWALPPAWRRCLLGLFLGISLALQVVLLLGVQPLGVVMGLVSPLDFLTTSRAVWTYPAVRWANENLPDGSRLYMIGTGQTYYLRHDALADSTVANMDRLFSTGVADEAANLLNRKGFTHLFVSDADMGWHLANRDPDGRLARQKRLLEELLGSGAALLYRDGAVRVYRLQP